MKKNKKEIEFICPKCKTIEYIPNDIVEFLDRSDQIGVDTSYSPRFDCEKCNGKMVPVYYVGANGTIYEYKNNLVFFNTEILFACLIFLFLLIFCSFSYFELSYKIKK